MPKETTNDELARMIAKGFEQTASKLDVQRLDERIDKLDGKVEHLDEKVGHLELRIDHIDATLSVMSRDIADIKKHFVYRDEFEDLMARVKYLETRLGVESGK